MRHFWPIFKHCAKEDLEIEQYFPPLHKKIDFSFPSPSKVLIFDALHMRPHFRKPFFYYPVLALQMK